MVGVGLAVTEIEIGPEMKKKLLFLVLIVGVLSMVNSAGSKETNDSKLIQLIADLKKARLKLEAVGITGTVKESALMPGAKEAVESPGSYKFAVIYDKSYSEQITSLGKEVQVLNEGTTYHRFESSDDPRKNYLAIDILSAHDPRLAFLRRYPNEFLLELIGIPWDKTLSRADTEISTKPETETELKGYIRVDFRIKTGEVASLWIDPNRDFSVMKLELVQSDNLSKTIEVVEKLENIQNSWIPTRKTTRLLRRKAPSDEFQIVITIARFVDDIKVDLQLESDSRFTLLPKDGETLINSGSKEAYIFRDPGAFDKDIASISGVLKDVNAGKADLKTLRPFSEGNSQSGFCGSYSLLLLCDMLGIKSSSKELAILSQSSADGMASLLGIQSAARSKGIPLVGQELTLNEWVEMKTYALVVGRDNPQHIYLFLPVKDQNVLVLDPPSRLKVYAPDSVELSQLWSGKALVFDNKSMMSGDFK